MKVRRRTILKVVVFLLAGAIINVAVAWGFAVQGFSSSGLKAQRSFFSSSNERTLDQLVVLKWGSMGWTWLTPVYGARGKAVEAESVCPYWADRPALAQPMRTQVANGWPFRSLLCQMWATNTETVVQSAFLWQHPFATTVRKDIHLPYDPIWAGFVINTIFYATVLWVLFAAPFKLRRWGRIKRGQCASCGYSLRGTVSEVCPECGRPTPSPAKRERAGVRAE